MYARTLENAWLIEPRARIVTYRSDFACFGAAPRPEQFEAVLQSILSADALGTDREAC